MKNEKVRGYRTIAECAEMAEVSRTRLYNAIAKKLIKNKKINGVTYLSINSLKTYMQNINRSTQGGWSGLDTQCRYYPLPGYDYLYMTADNSDVVNMTTGLKITLSPNIENQYVQVWLQRNGKTVAKMLHHLIVETQGKNAYNKYYIHHIDTDRGNNRLDNLLPVWEYQHKRLHRLLDKGLEKEYQKMIEEIRKENSEKLYKIPHLDFGKAGSKNRCWMYVTEQGYQLYLSGQDVPAAEVRMEFYG